MKVFFIPFYSGNPYQHALADALRTKGVEVKYIEYITNRLFPILRMVVVNGVPDIVHLHWTDCFLIGKSRTISILKFFHFAFELCLLKILGVRLIWTVHNLFSHEKRHPILEKYFHRICCMKLYEKIIVMSSFTVNAAIEAYKLPERFRAKFTLIPHGHYINSYRNKISKDEARDKLSIKKEKSVFLYFGHIRSYKGIFYLIEEFKKISDPCSVLLIVGKALTETLKSEVEKSCLGYEKIKLFLNFVPDDEVEIFMNASDVVVFPFQEILNSGSVILAMSFGKAVICPHMGSIPEIMDEKGGFLYDPNDELGLFDSLNLALQSDLPSVGRYNFQKAKSFDWDQIAQETYAIYKQ
ncbi:MAG: glycosyltransferase [Syntrophaceae bacterium]|nr:glycosyltransferase [Syntrophaceae bacterium]